MSKEANSFLHYAGARNDEAILKLRSRFGWEGYGLYFALLEMLREADNQELENEHCYLAFALHTTEDKIRDVLTYILELDLFKLEGNKFYSEGMKERVKAFEKKRETYRNNALKGKSSNSKAMAQQSLSQSKKEKENLNENKSKKIGWVTNEIPLSLDRPDCKEALAEFEQHRIEIKKKLTPLAAKKILNKYQNQPDLLIGTINHTIEKGWTGLHEPQVGTVKGSNPSRQSKTDHNLEVLKTSAEGLSGHQGVTPKLLHFTSSFLAELVSHYGNKFDVSELTLAAWMKEFQGLTQSSIKRAYKEHKNSNNSFPPTPSDIRKSAYRHTQAQNNQAKILKLPEQTSEQRAIGKEEIKKVVAASLGGAK